MSTVVGGLLLAVVGCAGSTPASGTPAASAGSQSAAAGGQAVAAGGQSASVGGQSAGVGGQPHPGPAAGQVAPAQAVDAAPATAPKGITFSDAPAFSESVKYVPNRSSVLIYVPFVEGAADYRVFALIDGVQTEIANTQEGVVGATISCAGLRQRNECDDSQAFKAYGTGDFFHISNCSEDGRSVDTPATVLRQVEVNGITTDAVLAVEAIDSLCPFPGALGNAHADVPIYGAETLQDATYNGKLGKFPIAQLTFPIRTEDEIRKQYKSLILNGQGHPPMPSDFTKGPFWNLAQPADPVAPKVLARAIISVSPLGTAKVPDGYKDTDIFDDFSDDTDQFKLVKARKDVTGVILPEGFGPIADVKLFENSKWNLYTFNGAASQMYVDKGELHSVLADEGQDVMASNMIYPKRAVQLPSDDTSYLHVTFETEADATQRRYWWFHLCGAAEKGKTYDGTALPNDSGIVALPFFMNPASGPTISMAGWNCLQFVPRGGDYDVLEGGDVHNPRLGGGGRPETDLRILVNRPTPAGADPLKDVDSVILLDPSFNPGNTQSMGGSWTRTWDDNHKINGMMLDEHMFVGQRTHFDFFISRSRVVVYADGEQKACDNFGTHKLTMAEAAVGIGHVIYHSSAERLELIGPQWIRTGQNYYVWDTPFVDVRGIDNVGIQEGVALPSSFNPKPCFTTPAQ